jgi:putative toxin-antitoxin system antitoxin component (TIGR02293 family)
MSLDVPMEKLAGRLGISKATLHRRKISGKLDANESDRVIRFARVMARVVEVFESDEYARRWLASPQFGIGVCLRSPPVRLTTSNSMNAVRRPSSIPRYRRL